MLDRILRGLLRIFVIVLMIVNYIDIVMILVAS